MNLPWRRIVRMVRSTKRLASFFRSPRVTKRDPNSADRMRQPGRMPARERTTVSTSGSSGINSRFAHGLEAFSGTLPQDHDPIGLHVSEFFLRGIGPMNNHSVDLRMISQAEVD